MLRGNTKKQLNYYPLIASLLVGFIAGYSTTDNGNLSYNNDAYQALVYSPSSSKTKEIAAVEVSYPEIKIDQQQAFNSVWNLPQVQRKAKEIEYLSKGAISVSATVDSSPTSDAPFYIVRVFENHPGKTTSPVYWFRVSSSSGLIEPLDLVKNQYISMEKWNPDGR